MGKPTAEKRATRFSGGRVFALMAMAIMAGLLFLGNAQAQAAQVNIAWDAPADSTITGYKVHIGGASGNYQQHIDVGNTTSYTTGQLNEGSTYYFAVSAYNRSGTESPYSNEITKAIAVQAASYTITASAATGGTITALNNSSASTATSGSTTITSATVTQGASQGFGIAPAAGYKIADVKVDGTSVGAVSSYTFSNVSANHSISASFAAVSVPVTGYTISASAGPGGSISPAGNVSVSQGASKTFAITPATGYSIKSLQVDGKWIRAASSYTFSNVTANHTILAAFQADSSTASPSSYTITASAGTGGSISPTGAATVAAAASKSYAITPAAGYSIAAVTVDGASVGAVSSYTFSNVTANHTISASFAVVPVTYTISASAGAGGSISPAGNVSVSKGASKSFTITPNAGYSVKSLQVDGKWITAAGSYTFSNVSANHTILAAFQASGSGTTAPTSGQVVFATNSGGASFRDAAGVTYGSDSRYTASSTKTVTSSFSGTTDDTLYQSYRYGNSFAYNIPLANGSYSAVLKFADNSATGQRVFDVRMEGRTVLDNLDIYARSGNNTAYDVTIPVDVTDGTLNIDFASSKGNAKINAIVIKTR